MSCMDCIASGAEWRSHTAVSHQSLDASHALPAACSPEPAASDPSNWRIWPQSGWQVRSEQDLPTTLDLLRNGNLPHQVEIGQRYGHRGELVLTQVTSHDLIRDDHGLQGQASRYRAASMS